MVQGRHRGGKSRGIMLSEGVKLDGKSLWTLNANPGKSVYGEQLRRQSGDEWRRWDPRRSKLSAALLRTKQEPASLLPEVGSEILYLGAGHGTTISHLHDHLCGQDNRQKGRLVGIDIAPRCMRDLTFLARQRKGIVPVLGDARNHSNLNVILPRKVGWLFQDVAQAAQVDIFLNACERFLANDGIALLSLKAASERWTGEGDKAVFDNVESKLIETGLNLLERIELQGFEDQHVLFVLRHHNSA